MTSAAESIILKIFDNAGEDVRVEPVLPALRAAYVRGEWNPTALAEVVENTTAAHMGAES